MLIVACSEVNAVDPKTSIELPNDLNMPELEEIVYSDDDEDVGAEADMNNLDAFMLVSPIPTTRIYKDHPVNQIIGDLNSTPQTRRMTKSVTEHAMIVHYDEVFAPVARIEAIRLFLAYASFKDFMVYQMDVKSGFLYGKIEEEVYVYQPPGFEDPDFPDRVYKVEKALYGLHQAPRAWYETLLTYLLDNGFQSVKIDKTLFIRRVKTDILLVQVSTPMENHKPLLKDADGEDVDEHLYRSMIGSLMYLNSSRPDIMFVDSPFDMVAYTDSDYVGASLDRKSTTGGCQFLGCRLISWHCKKQTVVANSTTEAEYIATSNCLDKKKVIITEPTIRRDLQLEDAKGTECLPTATIFEELTRIGYEKLTQKLTFYNAFFSPQWKFLIHIILQCLSAKTTAWNEFSSTMASLIICLTTNKKFNFSKHIFDSVVKNVDSMVKFWMYPRFVQVFVNQQLGDMSHHKKIYVILSHTNKIFANMKREGKGFSGTITPLFQTMMVQAQEEMGEEHMADETENVESVPIHSNDPLLSGEDSLKLNELMELYTNLQKKVLDLETTKTIQALEIGSLKRRVKKLEKKQRSRTHKLIRLYKGRKILDIDADEDITLDSTNVDTDPDMFEVYDLYGDEVFVEIKEPVVNAATTTTTIATTTVADEVEVKGQGSKDKGKEKMIEPKKPLKKKDQVLFDEQEAIRLQDQFDKEARVAREKEEANAVLVAQWNDIQDKELFNKAMKRVNTFVDFRTELVEGTKREEKEAEMKKLIKVVPDEEEVAIDAIPLATKPPSIVDWKIVKEGKISLFQIIRANGSSKRYSSMIQMLRDFDSKDLETLWKLVKAKHRSTRPEEGYERVL
ncbi:putative ribonuclease H-like domain-containing protein [Tanacetum coccineum]